MFALQVAARIESLFREEHGRSDLVLADVVDLFAGTSTGAIIATCLSWGKSVEEIERLYLDYGPLMFKREPWYRQWRSRYRADTIAQLFKETFREDDAAGTPASMGTSRLKTTLLTVMRNATTGSPWPVTNHPAAYYNDRARPDCHRDIPIWKLLRASTAAP
jgi:predicted acylesterase/phospholipase RssA